MRLIGFWAFVAACLIGAGAYVRQRMATPTPSTLLLIDTSNAEGVAMVTDIRREPHVAFLSANPDAFGHIGLAQLDALASTTITAAPECERSYIAKNAGLCLELNRERSQPRAYVRILDRELRTVATFPLAGLPIRARISPDERYAASTVFVTGENYASDFTTRTTLYDLTTRTPLVDLEKFTVIRDGRPFHEVDFNFWGVTFFQNGNRFYATLGTAGTRLLVEGDIARREMRVVADDVECPSLSPDERRIVFKRHHEQVTGWQLWAMDLQTKKAWPITDDKQDIDDQVEWLDNDHVIYARVFGDGRMENRLALWVSAVDENTGFDQKLFLRAASSPSVIR